MTLAVTPLAVAVAQVDPTVVVAPILPLLTAPLAQVLPAVPLTVVINTNQNKNLSILPLKNNLPKKGF